MVVWLLVGGGWLFLVFSGAAFGCTNSPALTVLLRVA
jgi:hypothetical protein